ncbi:hypothetical protein [Sphingomonas baiyangensis]|uniref:Uncharacterized protein n=1 Tax=Sphingomonas baiyangensis TaxID=2572576 RepID=A0A4U1L988_9SPHN|nr:hypothetical protein [Sphingomonas baiyangensis]TKD53103.1 hypothetical protein FBR43_01830 [Sphingomonas baiyangensis]
MTVSRFQDSKAWLVDAVGLGRDALHVHVGLAVMLATALLLRCDLRSRWPVVVVLIVALAGEIWDAIELWRAGGGIDLAENCKDLASTVFWPAAIMLLARHTLLFGTAPDRLDDSEASGDGGEQPLE